MADLYKGIEGSPITYLTADISANQTTISIADDSTLPDAPNICTIGYGENLETIKYETKSNGVLQNVIRGIEGTPRAWPAGTEVARFFTAYDHNSIIENFNSHLAEYANQLSNNGYQKIPGGLIIQWGVVNMSELQEFKSNGVSYKYLNMTYPISFPNNVFVATSNCNRASKSSCTNLTNSGMTITITKLSNVWEASEVRYMVIGY